MRPIRKKLLIALITGLLLVLTAMPASADGSRNRRGGDDGGFRAAPVLFQQGGDDGGWSQ